MICYSLLCIWLYILRGKNTLDRTVNGKIAYQGDQDEVDTFA